MVQGVRASGYRDLQFKSHPRLTSQPFLRNYLSASELTLNSRNFGVCQIKYSTIGSSIAADQDLIGAYIITISCVSLKF